MPGIPCGFSAIHFWKSSLWINIRGEIDSWPPAFLKSGELMFFQSDVPKIRKLWPHESTDKTDKDVEQLLCTFRKCLIKMMTCAAGDEVWLGKSWNDANKLASYKTMTHVASEQVRAPSFMKGVVTGLHQTCSRPFRLSPFFLLFFCLWGPLWGKWRGCKILLWGFFGSSVPWGKGLTLKKWRQRSIFPICPRIRQQREDVLPCVPHVGDNLKGEFSLSLTLGITYRSCVNVLEITLWLKASETLTATHFQECGCIAFFYISVFVKAWTSSSSWCLVPHTHQAFGDTTVWSHIIMIDSYLCQLCYCCGLGKVGRVTSKGNLTSCETCNCMSAMTKDSDMLGFVGFTENCHFALQVDLRQFSFPYLWHKCTKVRVRAKSSIRKIPNQCWRQIPHFTPNENERWTPTVWLFCINAMWCVLLT